MSETRELETVNLDQPTGQPTDGADETSTPMHNLQEVSSTEPVVPSENKNTNEVSDTPQVGTREENMPNVRRSVREHKPTEKARENMEAEISKKFWKTYNLECKPKILKAAIDLDTNLTADLLYDLVVGLDTTHNAISNAYEEVRNTYQGAPPSEIRKTTDRVKGDIDVVIARAQSMMAKGCPQGNTNATQRQSRVIGAESIHSGATRRSNRSKQTGISSTSSKRREVAAKAAALQAQLEAQREEAEQEDELERIELEEAKRRSGHEAELVALQARLEAEEKSRRAEAAALIERKRRALEQQRTERQLSIEKAKLRVYEDEERLSQRLYTVDEDIASQANSAKDEQSIPCNVSKNSNTNTQTRRASASVCASSPKNDLADIAQALTTAVNLNRLPIPEPPVFNGDPLLYPEWEASFSALVESRGIPPAERIHYLKRYLGGPAREAVSGYLLLKSENAFDAAKQILNERFGSPFVMAQAFRKKLEDWPRVTKRDGTDLRSFSDFLQQCQAAMIDIKELEILNDCHENKKMLQKLPDWLVTRWSRIVVNFKKTNGHYPPFSEFTQFIRTEAEIACDPITSLGAIRNDSDKPKEKNPNSKKRTPGAQSHAIEAKVQEKANSQKESCLLCKRDSHTLCNCRTFSGKPIAERQEFVKKNGLCFGCLGYGHLSKNCKKRHSCKKCNKKHPTSLHDDQRAPKDKELANAREDKAPETKEPTGTSKSKEDSEAKKSICGKVSQENQGIGSSMIVPVWVSSNCNPDQEHLVYALLDTQSDTSFILTETAEKLGTLSEPTRLQLTTMTAKDKVVDCRKYKDLVVRGYDCSTKIPLPVAYSRESIPAAESHIPSQAMAKDWPHLRGIAHRIQPIHHCEVGLLIGYNCPQALAPRNVITGEGNQPFAIETELGWSIVGLVEPYEESGDAIGITHRVITAAVPDKFQIKNSNPNVITEESGAASTQLHFHCKNTIKEMSVTPLDVVRILESDFIERKEEGILSQDDIKFLQIVKDGIHQREDGFYEMPLPFKEGRPRLPNNKMIARRRLDQLKRRFKSDLRYFEDYKIFIQDIIQQGDAERVPEDELNKETEWYIPHHGVYHPKKPTKIRVVFDCSAKYKGTSLNEHLLQGPDLTNALIGVLCRFRQEHVAIMCDIEKMFHKFKVARDDRDYLRFLWWEEGNLESEPIEYRMNVHLFGATSSPGCANFGLKRVAEDYKEEYGIEAANFIERHFYVDDGLESVETASKAIELIANVRGMCAKGNLRLHKFISNNREVMESIPPSECVKEVENLDLAFGKLPIERALGIQWHVESDCFQFSITLKDQPLTRRGVLSTIASVYDPLGLIAPFILKGKQILQQMCKRNTDWDEPLCEELRPRWEAWRAELPALADIKIERSFKPADFGEVAKIELHHFSDASFEGIGQCSYIRLVDKEGKVNCTLVLGKARVTPLRVTTIPRLELQAAVIAAKISRLLKSELEYDDVEEYFWTDSQAVLAYINSDAKRFHVFVANRVQAIRDSTKVDQWYYVPTQENPADHASRGLSAKELQTSSWLTGPTFLWKEIVMNEKPTPTSLSSDDPEVKKSHVYSTQCKGLNPLVKRFERFSDWKALVRAISLLQRTIRRKGVRDKSATNSRTAEDQERAEHVIIKIVQQDAFPVIKGNAVNIQLGTKRTSLAKLDPFMDEDGIMRVGGRLTNCSLQYGVKHPVILPKEGHVTGLLIDYYHKKVAHQGRGMTVNEIRLNGYWIVGCSAAVSSRIFKCTTCRRLRGQTAEQKMADLPEERLEASPPFTYCGMDCYGPFYIKERRKELKKYGVLFTCMASRAIHLELLDDMSTDAFINSLRCFIALRGPVRRIRCDQGSNFTGAKYELKLAMKDMKDSEIKAQLQENGCEFILNTPAASHKGGVWERQIRTVRSVLTVLLDQHSTRLDASTLRTFFYEAMAIVNSRPLTTENLYNSQGPEPLTPNHLLTMKSKIILPPPGEFVREDVYARKRWRKVQFLANEFWSRWKREYLLNLQARQKWPNKTRNFQVGDIVILKEDAVRGHWKLGKIIETKPGQDGLVRSVKLLMGDSTLTYQGKRVSNPSFLERPVNKLTLLLENDA